MEATPVTQVQCYRMYVHSRVSDHRGSANPLLLTDSPQVRGDGGPHADAALSETLSDGQLQIQQRQPLEHQRHQVGDQKRT